jgi:predicted transcriptional regulator
MTYVILIYIYPRIRISGEKLLPPCEVGVKAVLPAIRALMAKAIIEKHGMKEKQAAEILGLSQSAVSRYVTKGRGNIIVIESIAEVQTLVDNMITLLIKEPDKKTEILKLFCQTCRTIREKGLMCELCQKNWEKNRAETCTFCRST